MDISGKTVMVVGGTGKIGKHFTPMLVNRGAKVSTVALFGSDAERKAYEDMGVTCYHRDLGKLGALEGVPDKYDIVFHMAGLKFGSENDPDLTLRVNVYSTAQVMEHFAGSGCIAYASSGNVYPDTENGADESVLPIPQSFYALTRVGAELMMDWYSRRNNTPSVIQRIFYGYNTEFGVPTDIARQIRDGEVIDISTSKANVIWLDDLMDQMVESMEYASVPAKILNLTSGRIYSTVEIAKKLGELMGIEPKFKGEPLKISLLGDASQAMKLFGEPKVNLDEGLRRVAESVMKREHPIDKPTKWEKRKGF